MKFSQFVRWSFFLASLAVAALSQDATAGGQTGAPPGGFRGVGPNGQRFEGTGGKIASISGDTIKVKTPDGRDATVKITSETQFRRDRNPARLQDFKVGDYILVRGASTGEGQWTAQMVATRSDAQQQLHGEMGKNFVVGEVKSLDPPKMTITRPDGVTQTIEADENTSLKKMNESITMADIQPGDRVFARGEVKNGVFVPAVIMVGNAQMMQFRRNSGEGVEKGQQPDDKAQPKTTPK